VTHRRGQDLAEAGAASGQFAHLGDLGVDAALVPDPAQHLTGLVLATLSDQPVRALGWKSMPVNIKIAGIAARPNISRQFWLEASP
jgi:hypothetical protein